MARIAAVKFALTSVLLTVLFAPLTQAKSQTEPFAPSASATVSAAELPRQGRETLERIRTGGPFPYEKDGVVFANRERALPMKRRGYWREYTVPSPGSRDRGARRIVCGGPAVRQPEACYYTADHYASFRKIVE